MIQTGKKKIPVEFVYFYRRWGRARFSARARENALAGTEALRLQLRDLVAPHLPDHIELSFSGLAAAGRLRDWNIWWWLRQRRRRAVVILICGVAYRLTPDEIGMIREKSIAVGADHKDGNIADIDLSAFDFHVSSSLAGARALSEILAHDPASRRPGAFASVLFQSYDTRLLDVRFPGVEQFSPVYIGSAGNAEIPPSLRSEIPTIEVISNGHMKDALRRMPEYNFHFAVRPDAPTALRRAYKPFTKGANAAVCGANVLVNEQVDDVVDLLGRDYPYLVRSNANGIVDEAFRRARDDFGGPEWQRGLDAMRDLRERLSGPALARQLTDIVTRAAG